MVMTVVDAVVPLADHHVLSKMVVVTAIDIVAMPVAWWQW